MTSRRHFLVAGGAFALVPRAAWAQAEPPLRVGILRPTAPFREPAPSLFANGIETALRARATADGRTVVVESRYADLDLTRLPALVHELVQARCDVIVTVGSSATLAARAATTAIPIVMFGNFDPVGNGLVASLSRPGGNVTGVLIAADGTLAAKRLGLLRETLSRATRVAMLVPADPGFRPQIDEAAKAAATLGVALPVVEVRDSYDAAFAAIVAERAQAVLVGATTYFVRDRRPIIALAVKHRLPTCFEWPEQVEDGGFMAYGASLARLYARVADYVLRIAKGAAPGALAVEQPTQYELAINLGTAKAIGLAVPQTVLLRADRVFK